MNKIKIIINSKDEKGLSFQDNNSLEIFKQASKDCNHVLVINNYNFLLFELICKLHDCTNMYNNGNQNVLKMFVDNGFPMIEKIQVINTISGISYDKDLNAFFCDNTDELTSVLFDMGEFDE